MKKPIVVALMIFLLGACNKSETSSVAPSANTVQITSFSPTSGLPGDVITLTGINFDANKSKNTVKFGDKVAVVNSSTATELKVVVPTDATTGKISVTVNSNTTTSSTDFTVNKPQVLSLTGFSPTSGLSFDTITLTGTLFDIDKNKNTVKFGNSAAMVISATATELKVLVPDGGKISVKVGTQTVTSDDSFTKLSIYVSGFATAASGIRYAVYWKDGNEIILSDALTDAFATDIAVSGGNVYVTGTEATAKKYIAKYWKNANAVPLTNGIYSATASGIAIEGNNVYTCGSERNDKGDNVAKYWKNNTPVILTDKPGYNSATAISVVGSNTYTAVYKDGYPTYFENSTPQILSSTFLGSANAISVRNNDIYTAGDSGNKAKYWKNKTPVSLTDNSESYSSADAIFLSGNDVYTAGQFRKTATTIYLAVYWKNNKQIALTDGSKSAAATDIEVLGNSGVYICGYEGNKAKLWKNGKVLYDLTDGFTVAQATGIVIAP
ncbi:MAG: IPT/TIG domain-containing protein [Verrucomicrobia bacterium]|nr:IPT/TIG domain-containing protein [Cytophagales bacterium]